MMTKSTQVSFKNVFVRDNYYFDLTSAVCFLVFFEKQLTNRRTKAGRQTSMN